MTIRSSSGKSQKETLRQKVIRSLDESNKKLITADLPDLRWDCIEQAIENRKKAESIGYQEGIVDAYLAEAKGNSRVSGVEELDALYEKAHILAQEIPYPQGIAYAKIGLARRWFVHREFLDKALIFASDALTIAARIKNRHLEWASLRLLSAYFSFLGDIPRAFELFKKALANIEAWGSPGDICITLIESDPYLSPPALYEEYYKRAVDIASENKIPVYLKGKVLERYAVILSRLGKYDESRHFREELRALLRSMPDFEIPYTHLVIGDLCMRTNENEQAIREFETALEIGLDPTFQRSAYLVLGKIYAQSSPGKALDCFQKALLLPADLSEDPANDVHAPLAAIYHDLGEDKKAFEQYSLYVEKSIEAKERERKQTNEYALINKRFIESQQREKELTEELEAKSTALTAKAMLLAEQTDLMANFRDDLKAILRKVEANDPAINEIRHKLRDLPEAVNWKDFDEQFQSVHPRFQDVLQENYPALTKMELKNCVLLRLNLNSRDISKLLCLSKRTIESHRHSIRKKLALKPDEDVAKFLQRI